MWPLLLLACRPTTEPPPTPGPTGVAPTGDTGPAAPTGHTGAPGDPWPPIDGFTLWAPIVARETWLFDGDGAVVHTWSHDALPGVAAELRPDGTLIRAARVPEPATFADNEGGVGGAIEVIDPDGRVSWRHELATDTALLHHDFVVLPNGNLLATSFDARSEDEVTALGRDPAKVGPRGSWGERVLEICRAGPGSTCVDHEVVWSWSVWDHVAQDRDPAAPGFVPDLAAAPGLVDIDLEALAAVPDWLHVNAIDHDPASDRVSLSVRNLGEVWLIDRSTGALVGRFGRGTLDGQHDAHFVPDGLPGAGDVLVFDNGRDRGWSSVQQWCVPPACATPAPVWVYEEGPGGTLFSVGLSSAQRLPDGATVVTLGTSGEVREVEPDGTVRWRGVAPVDAPMRAVFRGPRYPGDFPGLP